MKEDQQAWIHQIYIHAAGQILQSTPKLFIDDPNKPGQLAAHGSAVLLKVENDHYLLTAAHCIFQDGKTNPIKVLDISGHPHTIKGAVAKSKGTPDNIDVAAVKLSNQSTEILTKTCVFLDGTYQIMLNGNIRHETDYLSVGYPNTTTDIDNRRKKIRYNPLVYISKSVNAEAYLKLDVNPSQSILLGYNQRKSTFVEPKELNMGPDPTGTSGGGLWYIPRYDVPLLEDVQYLLCGLLVEHYSTRNLVKATKTEEIIPLIRSLRFKNPNVSKSE